MKNPLLTGTLLIAGFVSLLATPSQKPLIISPKQPDVVFNRAPLADDAFAELPLGAIKPKGWLLDQLERQRDGMTGHLDSLYAPIVGDNNAWIGGEGDTRPADLLRAVRWYLRQHTFAVLLFEKD